MGFSHLARKGVAIGVVLKGSPPPSEVQGRWGETGKLRLELGLKGEAAGGWKCSLGGEAAESRRRGGNELASCHVGGTEGASPARRKEGHQATGCVTGVGKCQGWGLISTGLWSQLEITALMSEIKWEPVGSCQQPASQRPISQRSRSVIDKT